eukprot:TRINITY_DN15130_c0_g3_i2.p2 TRINITY_DN15130_c0_g3~~TRINITY_DN15130_c0_g3_i2.p2  ORF type:complete len:225 (+),score=8.98 TRINITY_DN15130_c0_g3_i2:81-677(+)
MFLVSQSTLHKKFLPIQCSSVQTTQALKKSLLQKVKGSKRGLLGSANLKQEIEQDIQELAKLQQNKITTGIELSAQWKLIWTTEKETLFIIQSAGFFGTQAGDIFQTIDIERGRLQNVINFPPNGYFLVDSSLEAENDKRVQFQFQKAMFKVWGKGLQLPPYGKGWFDTYYLDDDMRISKDIRNDYLITTRNGPAVLI